MPLIFAPKIYQQCDTPSGFWQAIKSGWKISGFAINTVDFPAVDRVIWPYERRILAVRLYSEGWSVPEIPDMVGCSESHLRRWCAWYVQGGLERLADQQAAGNNAKLSPEQRAVLERVRTYRPDQLLPADVRIRREEFWTVSERVTYARKITNYWRFGKAR